MIKNRQTGNHGQAGCQNYPFRKEVAFVSRGDISSTRLLKSFLFPWKENHGRSGSLDRGFTDCALQHGAKKVFAIDVGYGQLAWKLRNDSRVVNMERTNVRFLEADSLGEQVDAVSIDVAFISLDKVLPAAYKIMKNDAFLIAPSSNLSLKLVENMWGRKAL